MDKEREKAKKDLINFMHICGFDWIDDVALFSKEEYVASKRQDGTLWWRPLEVEGSGFTRLFKGSIKEILNEDK